MEYLRIYDHSDGEGAAGKVLTVSAVTCENHKRRLIDLVAKPAALAAAGLRKSHRTLPVNDLKRRYHIGAYAAPNCYACPMALIIGGTAHGRTGELVMTTYHKPDSREWSPVKVRGIAMENCLVFEGDGVRSGFVRMASGCQIPHHHHSSWVQIAVISGRIRVEQDESPAQIIPAGGVYFVSPGEDHVETAEVETILLVTKGEDGNNAVPV